MNKRLLKTNETSTVTVLQEIYFDTENLTDTNHTAEVTVYILIVDLDTLKLKLMCTKCKCIVDPHEILICSSSYTSKLTLFVQPEILVLTFGVPLDEIFKLAKDMLKAEVKIRYSLVGNKVTTLEKVHI